MIQPCSPSCATLRPSFDRPFDIASWSKAELLAEQRRLSAERATAVERAKKLNSELLAIPRWVRVLCQTPIVRRLGGRR